jgi:hypothetical protein
MSSISGRVPIQTLAGNRTNVDRQHESKAARLAKLRSAVKPLSIECELRDGRISYEGNDREIKLTLHHEEGPAVRWYSRAFPPSPFVRQSADDDEPPLAAHHIRVDADIWWLPFTELVDCGRFVRMQDAALRLSKDLDPGCYYLFVSHHWLDSIHPDPDGRQAALVAWQVLGHLLNAIWVGVARGRHTPRRRSGLGHIHVGVCGSGLAESILVNLLRPLPDETFAALVAEAEWFDDLEDGFGARQAFTDIGLQGLKTRLDEAPILKDIVGRFRLWYDFACMPQHPRTPEEQDRFETLLGRLGVIQILSRTVVLLDRVEDYFSRGWCNYESILAHEYLSGTLDLWQGGEVVSNDVGERETAFRNVLMDRPHLVWRGILDTELFGIQSSSECMDRLALNTTRPEDLAIVYRLLRELGPPTSIHYDDCEVVTGVFPLPVQSGRAVVIEKAGLTVGAPAPSVMTLNAGAKAIATIGPQGLPAYEEFDVGSSTEARLAHVAVFARCEGEAIQYAHWVRENRSVLESALGVDVRSLSWVASDIAPVGHFAMGELAIRPVDSELWILLGADASLGGGYTPRILTETLRAAGLEYVELAMDTSENNLRRYVPIQERADERRKELLRLELDDDALTRYPGGLFRPQLLQNLGARP